MSNKDAMPAEVAEVLGDMRSAGVFLTRVPARLIGVDPSPTPDFRRASRVFPVVGCLIGLAGGIVLWIALAIGMPALAAATLAVTATMALTGGLHEDGLADTADSFGGATAEQRLQIMDDSRIGTFGAAALVLTLLIRVTSLAALAAVLGPSGAAAVLVAAEGISRAAMVRLWHELPAARLNGLAHESGPPDHTAMLIALVIGLVLALLLIPVIGLRPVIVAAILAAAASYGLTRLVAQALGGRTGDTLGACQQVALAAFLVGAATV
jgi:adenosylcobinamide-GDP ribazoletransferase